MKFLLFSWLETWSDISRSIYFPTIIGFLVLFVTVVLFILEDRRTKKMNKEIGNEFERRLINLLYNNGMWCHLFAYKPEGQPCDIVALRNNICFLIDVKHCSKNRFPFSDIRSNQKTCFEMARKRGNENLGFAIYFDCVQDWKWMSYEKLLEMIENGCKSITVEECEDFDIWNW